MESPAAGNEPTRAGRSLADAPDLWLIAAWWVLVLFLGFARWDYTGDGLRHLSPIVGGGGPRLGEPRWLLFPAFLYALLRPFVVVGIAPDVGALARVMMGATAVAAGAYMLALRSCLIAARVDERRRAAALALAGATAGLLLASTDLMEPIFGATLVVCVLGWAATRIARPVASAEERRRALVVAVAAIALAALLYQGLVLALGLLPLVFPREALRDRRAQVYALLIVAAVPVVMLGALLLSGDTLTHALERALRGEENVLYTTYMKKSGVTPRLVALVGGPPQGLAVVSGFHGFNGLLASLRGGGPDRVQSLRTLATFGFGGLIVALGVFAAVRRRDFVVLFAFGVMMLLPVVRCQQYGYLKYYIFMAVIVAFAAARARPALVAGLAVALLLLNTGPTIASLPTRVRDHREQLAAYGRADVRSCWMATGWTPPYSYAWPGSVCGVLAALASGHGQTEREVVAVAHAAMTSCLDTCFCRSSGVFMNDMTEEAVPLLAASAQQFQYGVFDLGQLVLPAVHAERVSSPGGSSLVYRYPAADQRRICESVTRAREAAATPPAARLHGAR